MKRISCVTLLLCLTYLSFSQTIKDDSGKEYPIKFSASPDTIKINQNLPDGINEINKTRSGYTMSVKVKDHKITDMNWVDPLGKKLSNYVQVTPDANAKRVWVCLHCGLCCMIGNPPPPCTQVCRQVSCNDPEKNAGAWIDVRKSR